MESKEQVFMTSRSQSKASITVEELWAENAHLRQRLNEIEETIRAIRDGTVDAFVVGEGDAQQIYTLQSADRPFRLFVESMQQGAATLCADGTVAYCNQQLAELLETSYSELLGVDLRSFVANDSLHTYNELLSLGPKGAIGEVYLRPSPETRIPVLLTINAMPPDCGAALCVLVTDLTNEKYHEELAAAHEALRKTEFELRRQGDQLSVLLETAAMGLHRIDENGIILWANDAELQLLGYSRDEFIGHHIAEFHVDKGVINSILTRISRGERLHDVEAQMKGRDGSVKTVLIDSGVLWEEGRVMNAQCFIRDITAGKLAEEERRRTEEALRESEARLATFLEQLPVGVAAFDLEGHNTISNAAMRNFAQSLIPTRDPRTTARWKAFDFRGQPVPPQDWPGARALLGHMVSPGVEMTYTTDAGTQIWTRVSAAPLRNQAGKMIGAMCVIQDIDAVKRAELAMRESADRYRSLVSVIADVPWTANAGGQYVATQPAWAWFTGQSWEEYRGFGWIEAFHPEDRDEIRRTWQAACEAKSAYVSFHGRLWHEPTRQYRHFEAQATPVFNPDGTVREWVGAYTDINTRKQLEQQLEQRAMELARALEERKRLDEERERLLESERYARTEAERVTRLKEEFLSTVSHELRTPLNAILGWTQLMQQSSDEHTRRQGLDAIERGARGQALLIDELLDVSRIVSGKMRLETEVLELGPLVESAVETLRPAAEAKAIQVSQTLAPNTGPIKADPARLQQTIWNLLSNAIKFTPKGGKVEIRVARDKGSVQIKVIDSGPGVPKKFLPYVFDRFRQADNSTTRAHGGLGLGLAIVKHIVELHGGTVEVESEEGKGATFTVSLPANDVTSGASSPKVQDPIVRLKNVKVLVVDDDPSSREIVRRILTNYDAQVSTAQSADEALPLLAEFDPHVLISDIGMPGKDGLTFIREIRRLEAASQNPRRPAIALTAFARAEDRIRVLQAGYNMHVSKPIDPRELLAVVGSLAAGGSNSVSEH
jgi:PAS domain S-box-containing protein